MSLRNNDHWCHFLPRRVEKRRHFLCLVRKQRTCQWTVINTLVCRQIGGKEPWRGNLRQDEATCFTGRWAKGFWKWEPQNRKTREALKGPDGWEICIPGPHESSYWLAWEKRALKPPYQCALIFRTSQQATARRLSRNLTIPRRKKYSVERAEDSQALEASLDFNFELFQAAAALWSAAAGRLEMGATMHF